MNKYIKFALAAVAFVVFLGGIYFLYDKLSAEYKPQQNLVVEGTMSSAAPEATREPVRTEMPSWEPGSTGEASGADGAGTESSQSDAATSEEEQSNLAIDFTMENALGEEVTLFDFVGRPIVLNFWASWCGPCKAEIPDFQTAYEKYDGEIEFLMVNMTDGAQETKESAMKFIEEQGYTLPFYFDTQLQGAYTYSVYSLPTTFFINAEGEMIAYAQGMIDAETLEQGISMIYDGE